MRRPKPDPPDRATRAWNEQGANSKQQTGNMAFLLAYTDRNRSTKIINRGFQAGQIDGSKADADWWSCRIAKTRLTMQRNRIGIQWLQIGRCCNDPEWWMRRFNDASASISAIFFFLIFASPFFYTNKQTIGTSFRRTETWHSYTISVANAKH